MRVREKTSTRAKGRVREVLPGLTAGVLCCVLMSLCVCREQFVAIKIIFIATLWMMSG
jgi:hypothetical protein